MSLVILVLLGLFPMPEQLTSSILVRFTRFISLFFVLKPRSPSLRARAAAAKAGIVETEEARAIRLSSVPDFEKFRLPMSMFGKENGTPTAAETKALGRAKVSGWKPPTVSL